MVIVLKTPVEIKCCLQHSMTVVHLFYIDNCFRTALSNTSMGKILAFPS